MDQQTYEQIAAVTGSAIADWRTCVYTGERFALYQQQRELEQQFGISWQQNASPQMMQRILASFRNERHLYRRTCSLSGQSIVSTYAPQSQMKVYSNEVWRRESNLVDRPLPSLDRASIKRECHRLYETAGTLALHQAQAVNAAYANHVNSVKNVYLSYLVYYESEDVYYSYYVRSSRDIVDCYFVAHSERLHECIDAQHCAHCHQCLHLANSQHCAFSVLLDNCQHCLFCANLVGKSYCVGNQQYSQADYHRKREELLRDLGSYRGYTALLQRYEQLQQQAIYPACMMTNVERCAGNGLSDSSQSILCFDGQGLEGCVNVFGGPTTNCVNLIGGLAQHAYNCCYTGINSNRTISTYGAISSSDVYASREVYHGSHALCCFSLHDTQYIFLNRKIDKEQWHQLLQKVKELSGDQWGAYLDQSFAPFPYNDSLAADQYPVQYLQYPDGRRELLNADGVGTVLIENPGTFLSPATLDLGGEQKLAITWRTKDLELTVPAGVSVIPAAALPDAIDECSDTVIQTAIQCCQSQRPYKIIAQELAWYRQWGLPLPRHHHEIRHQKRLRRLPRRQLFTRRCDYTGEQILSVYAPDDPRRVYSQTAYREVFYG